MSKCIVFYELHGLELSLGHMGTSSYWPWMATTHIPHSHSKPPPPNKLPSFNSILMSAQRYIKWSLYLETMEALLWNDRNESQKYEYTHIKKTKQLHFQ